MNILMNFKTHIHNKDILNKLSTLVRSKMSKLINANETIKLIFEDINGVRNGIDKRCTLLLVTNNGQTAVYHTTARNEVEGLKLAIKSAKSKIKKLRSKSL